MMAYDPDIHHRRSIRYKGYDYSLPGAYFVTVCVHNRRCVFGEIENRKMRLNETGRMVVQWWNEIYRKFPNVHKDEFVLMPNHLHGIMIISRADTQVRPDEGKHIGLPLHRIVQWFKTMTTNEYVRNVKKHGWPPFAGRLWQRNYYERIIRNDNEMRKTREYIFNNPACWDDDEDNPVNRM